MSEMTNVDNSSRTKLYNWRMANNLSQREAAVSLGTTQATMWKWESGKATPRAAALERILAIIDAAPAPAPAQEPEEEPWVPGVTAPDDEDIDHVYTARPKTFRERMEQRYGSMDEYYRRMSERVAEREEVAEEQEDPVEQVAELPLESHAEPTPSLFCMPLQRYDARAIAEARASAEAYGIKKPAPSLVKLTKVIGFLECLALYAAEGVAEPLEQQIKTLQDIAEEMSA